MKVILTKEQLDRVESILKEDVLDDIFSKGGEYLNKGIEVGKDLYNKAVDAGSEMYKDATGDSKVGSPVKSSDVPGLADTVGTDVNKFFEILDKFDGELKQQSYGTMKHQQEVEAIQIGLSLLGYSLPRFGVDGLFGPETAIAVNKYKSEKNLTEAVLMFLTKGQLNEIEMVTLNDTNYSHVKFDNDGTKNDSVNQALLDDIETAASAVGIVATITTAVSGHAVHTTTGNISRHGFGVAADIAILNGKSTTATNGVNGNKEFRELGNQLKDALVSLGYVWNTETGNSKAVLWQTDTGGNHYNHLHVSNKAGASDAELAAGISVAGGAVIDRKFVDSITSELKSKGVTSEDLSKFVDPGTTTGGSASFTDLDTRTTDGFNDYAKICQNYIDTRNPSAFVTGEMMADGARKAQEKYNKYVPPELALAQITLEGGLLSDTSKVPIETKNPFNVGNTGKAKVYRNTFQAGVDAYYDLLARNYLVKGKTAADLVNAFTNFEGNSYAEAGKYEEGLRELLKSIRKRNAPIYASLALNKKDTLSLTEAYDLLLEADKRQAIMNVFGLKKEWADEFHAINDKVSVWIADSYIKEQIKSRVAANEIPEGVDPKRYVIDGMNVRGPRGDDGWNITYKPGYDYINHWIKAPDRNEQINLKELDYDTAHAQAEQWHAEVAEKQRRKVEKDTTHFYKEKKQVFIDMRNDGGVGYYWVHLNTSYCDEEHARMGHCARSNTGQLISLRHIDEEGKGKSLLTVDYRPGGVIGDFHAAYNDKPPTQYHPQIIKFLVNTTYPVTELATNVHRYDDNFHLADLSREDLNFVIQNNPSLKYNFSNKETWPTIIDAIISGEIDPSRYSTDQLLKLLGKAKDIDKVLNNVAVKSYEELKKLFTNEMIMNVLNNRDIAIYDAEVKIYLDAFGEQLINKLQSDLDASNSVEDFISVLRTITSRFFSKYEVFCPYIDYGFNKFPDQHAHIISQRGFRKTLLSCTDSVEFLHRYDEILPQDKCGNIAVRTEDGLWGLIKSTGETLLHPQFNGISHFGAKPCNTYFIKTNEGNMFINIETGERTRLNMK